MARSPLSRLHAAAARLGIRVADGQKDFVLPVLSAAQLERLEQCFPMRLLEPGESVDAYRHYCGAAQLVQELKLLAKGDADEEDDLDLDEVGEAIAKANGTTYVKE